ncbi:MAG: 7TM domain-containing protein [Patescibacteria group bacterium]|jgi:hypothetical protein
MNKLAFITNSIFFLSCLFLGFSLFADPVVAQTRTSPSPTPEISLDASVSAEASLSGEKKEASASSIVKKVVEKEPDLTEPKPEVKGKLEKYLEENPVGELNPLNVGRHAIRSAIAQGVPANTIVLILLFPLVATVVVIARHVVGLKSFGIFTPALLAVAFLATGLTVGIFLFIAILFVATLLRMLLKRARIQYLPRMALFILFVSLTVLGILLISPALRAEALITIGIFPILILILLVEDFLDLQITRSFSQALIITVETLIVAVMCFYLMNWEILQKFALVNPELFVISLVTVIALVEQYSGLRLLEIWRFRKLVQS